MNSQLYHTHGLCRDQRPRSKRHIGCTTGVYLALEDGAISSGSCRRARIVRNHIGCALLVWIRLQHVAYQTKQTIYKVKHGWWAQYLQQQLKSPSIPMELA